jgi:ribosomal-protein-alanine N-acetyltransferase
MTGPAAVIETERLRLRNWTDADSTPFAALNADPRVMEFFPRRLSRAESDAAIARYRAHFDANGWGLFAVEEKATGSFIGFVGLAVPRFAAPFMPAVEIAWRLTRQSWGQGYATEAARAVLALAFDTVGLDGVIAMTTEWNRPSRRVMEKLGMTNDPVEDFDHPMLPEGHKLRRHVLYRLSREDWRKKKEAAEAAP